MTPEFYRVIHVTCALLLYLSLGAVVFGPRDEKPSKLAMMLHGIALLLMVVAGVGIWHKDGNVEWGNWLSAKIGCWVFLGALGPNPIYAEPDDEVLALLRGFGAEVLHWRADALTRRHVELAHAAGLLAFSYTPDEPEGWRRGRELGLDAMCTNDPAAMQDYMSGA